MSVRAFEWNTGAIKLYERLGFKHEGRGREALWHEGRWWDGLEMGMLEGEWRELVKKSKGEDVEVEEPAKEEKEDAQKVAEMKEDVKKADDVKDLEKLWKEYAISRE